MTRSPRLPVLALLALVASVGASSGCRRETPVAAVRLIPSDASMVIRLDVVRMRGTLMHQRLVSWLDDNDYFRWKMEDLAKKTGFTVLEDVDGAVVASADAPGGGAKGDFGIVVMGRFDAKRLGAFYEAHLRKRGDTPRSSSYAGHTLISDAAETANLVVLNKRLAILASKGWIRRMLDLAAGKGRDVRTRPEMAALLGRLPVDRIVGMALHVSEAQRREAAARELPFFSVTGAVVMIDSGKGLDLSVRLENTTPEGARTLATKITAALKEMRNSAMVGKAGLAATFDLVSTQVEGQACVSKASLTKSQFDDTLGGVRKFIAGAGGMRGGMRGLPGGLDIPGVFGGDPRRPERNLGGPGATKPGAPGSQP